MLSSLFEKLSTAARNVEQQIQWNISPTENYIKEFPAYSCQLETACAGVTYLLFAAILMFLVPSFKMREGFVSLLTFLAVVVPCFCSDKDGFNFYKDYLRGRADEGIPDSPEGGERTLYFYRTPVQLYPGLLPALEQEHNKRTGNAFKNHMLSKDIMMMADTAPGKRSSKTALALMLEGKHPYHMTTLNDDFGTPIV